MAQIKIEQVIKIGRETFERNNIVIVTINTDIELDNEEIVGRLEYMDEDKIIIDTSEKFQSSFKQINPKHIVSIGKTTIY